ncbi:hypothetical protein BCR33DRAFT_713996 [Rhizoclosmatium globosum]|uniref:Uncharacterized protein n=1 Tax=Rhizoclosmatium globosum TaxID=329046 RepID=A0A1Y2CPB3_9FUNG|nr:hypothetical protein BCR33DRAFT_713996 [Rhizoclosmatium globosum]|eukprot:ORY48881.1 hypothetical protein BCR33DRAFT_713996 [Rhizoclosmatium globosum]
MIPQVSSMRSFSTSTRLMASVAPSSSAKAHLVFLSSAQKATKVPISTGVRPLSETQLPKDLQKFFDTSSSPIKKDPKKQ